MGAAKELFQARAATIAEIKSQIVYIHADEFVGAFLVHSTAEG